MQYTSKYKIGDKVKVYIGGRSEISFVGIVESVKFTNEKVYCAVRFVVKDGIPTVFHDIDIALLEKYV